VFACIARKLATSLITSKVPSPKLSVNVNKIALLRNSRGANRPDVLQVAADCVRFGAHGITVHPRPDGRHIRTADVFALKPFCDTLGVEFNIEGYPTPDFMRMVCEVKPAQVTLVPDAPGALTSDAGWDVVQHRALLQEVNAAFHAAGIRVSLFMECDTTLIQQTKAVGADRIELYTGPYAQDYATNPALAVAPYVAAAHAAADTGLGLNAGHDLSLENLRYLKENLPGLQEVSIGHALICDALYLGLEETIKRYRACLA